MAAPTKKPQKIYDIDIEGEILEWQKSTISVPEIRDLAGWDANQQVMEVNLQDNTETTLAEDVVVELKPGHGFAKKIRFQRG
ncbi:MAG: hypothetical protein ACJ77M_16690 [Thermoleophilaceae bacterium]